LPSSCFTVSSTLHSLTPSVLVPYPSVFSFFLMLPRPPRSTLFPYTTLFRSLALRFHGSHTAKISAWKLYRCAFAQLSKHAVKGRDRKSTRLNSSHVEISYAVFCLKKKKYCNVVSSPVKPSR